LLRQLLADPSCSAVTVLARRALPLSAPKLTQHVVDFDRFEANRALLAVDDIYCCLGTTIKQAGSKQAFRTVDFEYPLAAARLGAELGARQYLVVTAVGANPKSRIFYSRVKGELEVALRELSFPQGLKVFRPSMLLGDRRESRPMERSAAIVMRAAAPLFTGAWMRYRAIEAGAVARAMRAAAAIAIPAQIVYEGDTLFALAQEAEQLDAPVS
jgi:uncharacterized protein YbjT (DUF2867 family)